MSNKAHLADFPAAFVVSFARLNIDRVNEIFLGIVAGGIGSVSLVHVRGPLFVVGIVEFLIVVE